MHPPIFANGTSPELIALINAAPWARAAVEHHQCQVLDSLPADASTAERNQAVQDNNALNDAAAYALWRVADFPVATAADLHTKLSFMCENEMGDGRDWLPELLADIERITGEGVVE